MKISKARSIIVAALTGLLVAGIAAGFATATRPSHPPKNPCATVRVTGRVAERLRLHVDELRSYPAHEVDVTFQSGAATQQHHYVGALLTDVLASAKPDFDPAVKNDALRFWVEATGADDYAAIVSWGEIDPGFGARQVLLAYDEDGTDLCTAGPRLVVPGDIKGGRYVSTVVALRVGRAGGNN